MSNGLKIAVICAALGLGLGACQKEPKVIIQEKVEVKEDPDFQFKVKTNEGGGVDVEAGGKVENK